MCFKHWSQVPVKIQRWVWGTYQPGQCDLNSRPSAEWHKAADAAIDAVWRVEQEQKRFGASSREAVAVAAIFTGAYPTAPVPPIGTPLTFKPPPTAFAGTSTGAALQPPASRQLIEVPKSSVTEIAPTPPPAASYAYRFFLVHPKGLADEEMEQLEKDTVDLLREPAKTLGVLHYTVKLARDDYNENFARCNGWDGWIESVSKGTEYATGRRRFDGIVCSGRTLGRASAQIVHHALLAAKPVCAIDDWHRDGTGNARLSPIFQVVHKDKGNWQTGWVLV